jgi:hypothetical protein
MWSFAFRNHLLVGGWLPIFQQNLLPSSLEGLWNTGTLCHIMWHHIAAYMYLTKNTVAWSHRKNARYNNTKKAVCNKTKRKTKNEVAE